MASEPLAPELFEDVLEEAAALTSGKHKLDDPLGRRSKLLEFVQQVFAQLFRAELGIEVSGFTQSAKEEALFFSEGTEENSEVEPLLALFVDVCNMWPDVLSPYYGGSAVDFLEFRAEFVPALLTRLTEFVADNA